MPSAESYETAGFRSGLPVFLRVHVHQLESVEQASRDWRQRPAMVEVRARRGMRI